MAFRENITQLTTSNSNHADNFNKIHMELLENDKHLKGELDKMIQVVDDVPHDAISGLFFVRKVGLQNERIAKTN